MIHAQIIIGHLGQYNPETANAAKQALLRQGKSAVPHLVAALTHRDPTVVAEVAQLLGLFGKTARSAVPALVTISYVNNPQIRANAIASLGMIAEQADICTPVLKRYMKDEDVTVRRNTLLALNAFGKAAQDAAGELVDALGDDDRAVREYAAGILYKLGEVPMHFIKPISAVLSDTNPYVRFPIKNFLNRICNRTGMSLSELTDFDEEIPSYEGNVNPFKAYPEQQAMR